jgi:hypothetical protein
MKTLYMKTCKYCGVVFPSFWSFQKYCCEAHGEMYYIRTNPRYALKARMRRKKYERSPKGRSAKRRWRNTPQGRRLTRESSNRCYRRRNGIPLDFVFPEGSRGKHRTNTIMGDSDGTC